MSRFSAFVGSHRAMSLLAHELNLLRWSRMSSSPHPIPDVPPSPSLLIVDDYPDALDVWGVYLRAEGFTVLTASDGQSAFAEAVREKPDVIIMDLELPGKSGYEVARDLKARAGHVCDSLDRRHRIFARQAARSRACVRLRRSDGEAVRSPVAGR